MSGPRRLVSLRRRVDAARREGYDALWDELQREATGRGAHAWRFRADGEPESYLEFLEFRAGSDPRSAPEVEAVLRRMEREAGPAHAEEWREAGEP